MSASDVQTVSWGLLLYSSCVIRVPTITAAPQAQGIDLR